jgi:(p)ppGpp synthase/HD superfamily hydrolase
MNNKNQILDNAIRFAEAKHKNQKYGNEPYIVHPKSVVDLAIKLGYDTSIQVSCALHDVLEDTATSEKELTINFGEEVTAIVYSVSDGWGFTRSERKANAYPKIQQNWKATVVKILDRVSNIKTSIEHRNTKKYDMYRKEHKNMFESIHSIYHPKEVKIAWIEYSKFYDLEKDVDFQKFINKI